MRGNRLLVLYACTMLLMIFLGIGYIISMEHDAPEIILLPMPAVLTPGSEISVLLLDKSSGIRAIEVTAVIKGQSLPVLTQEFQDRQRHRQISFMLPDIPNIEAFRDDTNNVQGTLRITVKDHSTARWGDGNASSLSSRFIFDDTPPGAEISAISANILQGGSAAVSFRVSEVLSSAELAVGEHRFKAHHRADSESGLDYLCIFALPYCLDPQDFKPILLLRDTAGHESAIPLEIGVVPNAQRDDQITITPALVQGKAPEFSRTVKNEKDPLKLFLAMNGEVRRQNYAALYGYRERTAGSALWQGHFMRLPRSVKRGFFADRRQYFYEGKLVDARVHQGIDYASYSNDRIPAAAAGRVLLADYLGIHGNMALLDHGLGVQSLYSHMSRIDVKTGDVVQRGQDVSLTGTSGMAAGDHLHFEFFVGGVSVNPDEWFDPLWHRRLALVLQPAE